LAFAAAANKLIALANLPAANRSMPAAFSLAAFALTGIVAAVLRWQRRHIELQQQQPTRG
jgi:hypothetical protein